MTSSSTGSTRQAERLVLDRDPIEDIRATIDLRHVKKGGILYDGDTLDESLTRPTLTRTTHLP